jgi:hypothetical protein
MTTGDPNSSSPQKGDAVADPLQAGADRVRAVVIARLPSRLPSQGALMFWARWKQDGRGVLGPHGIVRPAWLGVPNDSIRQ